MDDSLKIALEGIAEDAVGNALEQGKSRIIVTHSSYEKEVFEMNYTHTAILNHPTSLKGLMGAKVIWPYDEKNKEEKDFVLIVDEKLREGGNGRVS